MERYRFLLPYFYIILFFINREMKFEDVLNVTNKYDEINGLLLLPKIFINNLISFIVLIVSGLLIGLPFVLLVINMYIIGLQISILIELNLPIILIIVFTLPHGIIEIPIIILGASIGLYLVHIFYSFLIKGDESYLKKENILKLFGLIKLGIILLFVSSVIESSIIIIFNKLL